MVGLSPVNDCLRLCNPVVRYHGIADFLDTNELAECDYDYSTTTYLAFTFSGYLQRLH